MVRGLSQGGEFPSHLLKGVRLKVSPDDAKWIRYDIIRSFDRPLMNSDSISKMDTNLSTELDWQLFQLQRKYLDYQVNIGIGSLLLYRVVRLILQKSTAYLCSQKAFPGYY